MTKITVQPWTIPLYLYECIFIVEGYVRNLSQVILKFVDRPPLRERPRLAYQINSFRPRLEALTNTHTHTHAHTHTNAADVFGDN